MSQAEPEIDRLAKAVTQYVIPLLHETLLACAERHQIAINDGVDNFSFGTDAWSLPGRKFKDAIEDESIPFRRSPLPGCTLHWEGVSIRHHKVGMSEHDDIAVSFPGNARALATQGNHWRQLSLDYPDGQIPESGCLVLAYMANSSDGLCAAYLARVGRIEHQKVVSWAETRCLYRREPPEDRETRDGGVPAEPMPTPVVRRSKRKKKDEDVG